MKTTIIRLFLLSVAFVTVSCANLSTSIASAESGVRIRDLIFTGDDFKDGSHQGMTGGEEGLVLEPGAAANQFESDAIRAPLPFNAVVPQWIAQLPEGAEMEVELRTSADGKTWGSWVQSHGSADWTRPEDEDVVGQMVLVSGAEELHRWAQVRVRFEGVDEAQAAALSQLRLTFIDSTDGPTSEELVEQQKALESATPADPSARGTNGYPKPFVVSRSVWCDLEDNPECIYSEGLEYYPVSHLIVHHTVSANSSSDWAATVRAIWSFHTFTREWGDIGYNYLVDPNGVIYEGHYGGDDVVGTHASGANAGTMAVALLGTFTQANDNPPGIQPPQPMQDAAVELLTWKADQRNINVFDASNTLPNVSWGLPNLMGHRDVYGTTECPGDQAHLLIPQFRQRIAQKLGQTDPHLYVDELSGGFTKNPSAYYEPPYLCGYNNHAWYAWSTTNPGEATAVGEWRPNVPADGRYEIAAYVPYCRTGRSETTSATYRITHAGGTTDKTVNMNANVGLWIPLGEYDLRAGTGNVIRLSNLTGDNGVGVWFDAIRLLPKTAIPAPTITNSAPARDSWQTSRLVNFAWQIGNSGSVKLTNLQISTDPTFATLLSSQVWGGTVTSGSFNFAQDYGDLYWRVIVDWGTNGQVVGEPWHFRLDATPPDSGMGQTQLVNATGLYRLNWFGGDAVSGLAGYNIDYRIPGQNWVRWLTNTTLTNASFYKPDPAQTYEFRSQAVDRAGNAEPLSGAADASTANVQQLPYSWRAPAVFR